MIVVDASVLASALADDDADGDLARMRLADDPVLHAPELIDVEVWSVLRRHVGTGALSERRALLAIQDLVDLPIVRYPHLAFAWRAWELRRNLTSYDAVYVALAEVLECPLVTADRRIALTPRINCAVEVLGTRG